MRLALLFVSVLFGTISAVAAETNLFVSLDGDAQFKSVQEAIMFVPSGSASNHVIIHLKPGVYKELVYIQREKRFFHLVGDDAQNTVATFDLRASQIGLDGKPIGTFRTASTVVDAEDFTAENITFENSAGPVGQALAIRIEGDRAIFRNCRFLGWQDTILANRGRQYFTNCYIAGHVDFIFGGATAFFENCHIHCLKDGWITAASTPDYQPYGFIFSACTLTGETPEVRTYLGRPWRIHASTAFLDTRMTSVVRPEGWSDWNKPEAHDTVRYAEFNSSGAGANPPARVKWAHPLTPSDGRELTPAKVLGGNDGWNPYAQVAPNPTGK